MTPAGTPAVGTPTAGTPAATRLAVAVLPSEEVVGFFGDGDVFPIRSFRRISFSGRFFSGEIS